MAEPTFECFALVEIFGHTRIAGKVTEQVIAGTGFVRVDVPELPPTKYHDEPVKSEAVEQARRDGYCWIRTDHWCRENSDWAVFERVV